MDKFCRVGDLFYKLRILSEKNIEVGEQISEIDLREQFIHEYLKQCENDHRRIQGPALQGRDHRRLLVHF